MVSDIVVEDKPNVTSATRGGMTSIGNAVLSRHNKRELRLISSMSF